MVRCNMICIIRGVVAVIIIAVLGCTYSIYITKIRFNKIHFQVITEEETEKRKTKTLKNEILKQSIYNVEKDKKALSNPTNQNQPLEVIFRDCRELCNTTRPGSPGPYFNEVKANIDCPALFKNRFIDRIHGLEKAPEFIPPELMADFTMNGKIKVSKLYFNQPYLGKKAMVPIWTYEQVEKLKQNASKRNLKGNYGVNETNSLIDGLKHAPRVKNGRVLVIGSENAWVEACVLDSGAREIVTLEYGTIKSEHPHIKTMTPLQFRQSYLAGNLGMFDAVVTFSSVEHSGLGRYGDALNPWGDIIAIARAWCVTKEGGSLTIGVMYNYENDIIRFNADRWYGKVRFPYLATNWKQLYRGTGSQRVHVFIKA